MVDILPWYPFKYLSHFYVPVSSNHKAWWNYPIFWTKDAWAYINPIFNNAINVYNNGNKAQAYYLLGNCLHVLEDMSSPPHVFGDAHTFEKNGYENWGLDHRAILDQVKPTDFPQNIDFETAFKKLAERTYRVARIQGHLDHDNRTYSGDLAEMFSNKNIQFMEYVYSKDQFGNEVAHEWRIANVGTNYITDKIDTNYGHPDCLSDWWRCQNFPGESGEYYYIESNQKDIFPVIYSLHNEDGNLTGEILNNPNNSKSLCEFWALDDKLMQNSVENTAGLMKYFYDLVNEPPYKV